ncbi:MAG TPA: hypothetical protein ENJ00_01625 [Phycisphaerales bacterium]|nr:hypothetical protein [Phycisphaerales bacterium]
MRSVFDQYSQPENRLTHALACTLDADRTLLGPFLRWAGAADAPAVSRLSITEQQTPGVPGSGDESDAKGIPDACVFDDEGWLMIIESKVQSKASVDQLNRHIQTAKRHDYKDPHVLLLTTDDQTVALPSSVMHKQWRDVYAWFRKRSDRSFWARELTRYMESLEARMIAENYTVRGTLTMFDGIRFDANNPYTYREGKRLIRLLGDELQQHKTLHKLGVDPKGERRSAITGRDSTRVWDFLPLRVARGATNFTSFPHFTMGIRDSDVSAGVTVPNGVRGGFRTRLHNAGEEGFIELLEEIERRSRRVRTRSSGAVAKVYIVQRHFHSQRSMGEVDAKLEMNLCTIVTGARRGTKYQPEWASAVYEILTRKRSNIQLGFQIVFQHTCPIVRSRKVIKLFVDAWDAMSPVLSFVLDDDGANL